MAGTDTRFNAVKFRDAINFAMSMGAPNALPVEFLWDLVETFSNPDPTGLSYSMSAAPTSASQHPPVTINCAVEYIPASTVGTTNASFGRIEESKLIVTVMDDVFPQIDGASYIKLNGNRYEIEVDAPTFNLFEVEIHQLYCTAIDES